MASSLWRRRVPREKPTSSTIRSTGTAQIGERHEHQSAEKWCTSRISFSLKENSAGTPPVEYFPFQKANTGSIVPAKLVKKVQPEYPAEAQKKESRGL